MLLASRRLPRASARAGTATPTEMHSSWQGPLEQAVLETPAAPTGGLRLLKLDAFLARARSGLACLYESLSDLPEEEREAHFIQAPLYDDEGGSEITPIREVLRREGRTESGREGTATMMSICDATLHSPFPTTYICQTTT